MTDCFVGALAWSCLPVREGAEAVLVFVAMLSCLVSRVGDASNSDDQRALLNFAVRQRAKA